MVALPLAGLMSLELYETARDTLDGLRKAAYAPCRHDTRLLRSAPAAADQPQSPSRTILPTQRHRTAIVTAPS